MTGFHRVALAIELIEAGIRCPHMVARAAEITTESASSLIDALDREGLGAMIESTGGWIFSGAADPKLLGERLN
jgi:hypothetical protein